MGVLALSSKKTASQLRSDAKASVEDVCVGWLLSLKAIIAFVSETKQKYDVDGTLDWQSIVGHFAGAKATKKKLKKKIAASADGVASAKQKNVKSAKPNASPAQKENPKSVDKNVKPATGKSPKVKPTPAKPAKMKRIAEVVDDSEEPVATTMVDPFFITDDGSNYISTAVIDRTQADAPDDNLNRRERRANRMSNNSAGPKAHAKNAKFNKNTPTLKSFGGSVRNEAKNGTWQEDDADVHPSWSAKRKQKTIPSFQGKKIKFDGGEDKPKTATTPASIKSSNETDDASKLHPSWAAKQKLKPVIAAFKGSKITFD